MTIFQTRKALFHPDTAEKEFERLYKAYFSKLYAYAHTLVRDKVVAEEMVQNVFCRLWEKAGQIEITDSVGGYLYRSVYYECLNYLKSQKIRQTWQQTAGSAESVDDTTRNLELSELEQRLAVALRNMPEPSRTIFRMSRFDELKYQEIADHLHIPVKAVEYQMGKALRLLRTQLAEFLPVVLLLLGVGWLFYTHPMSVAPGVIVLKSGPQTRTDTLPDGSIVTLNRHSTLTFRNDRRRSAALSGEAFFRVRPDKTRPFVIEAGRAVVSVVGTSFNVRSLPQKTEVVVESGRVEVTRGRQTIRLEAAQKVTVTADQQGLVRQKVTDRTYALYRREKLVFDRTPLPDVVALLNEVYGARIVVANKNLKNLQLTTTFHRQSLEDVLTVIQASFADLNVERKGELIILK